MNKITLTGRLAADAEIRNTKNGDAITGFRVASDVGFGDNKVTNWFACTIFGKRGEALAQYLTKGQQVTVFGQLTLREWQNKDGVKQLSPDVRVDEIELQGGKPAEDRREVTGGRRQEPARSPARQDDFQDTDLPF